MVELILNAGQRGERKSIRNPWALGSEPWTGAADWGRGLGSRTAIEHFELVSIDIYLVLVSTSAQVRFHAVQSDTDSACRSLFARPQRSAASGSTAGRNYSDRQKIRKSSHGSYPHSWISDNGLDTPGAVEAGHFQRNQANYA